ncbi:hypothetical protein HHI36_013053 [Cryptolaemus montrouzieri]|uniref:Uncharacterized protein n=1 Tax=Cryptolaemus montrouzieri TaxID=559131 RepID=A0ABD2NG77_9CUCU
MSLKTYNEKRIRDVDSEYIENAENKTKAVWSVINRKTKDRSDDNKSSVSDCEIIISLMQLKKRGKRSKLQKTQLESILQKKCEHLKTIKYEKSSTYLLKTCPQEIETVVKDMKSKSPRDYYELSVDLLKSVICLMSKPLSKIINVSKREYSRKN